MRKILKYVAIALVVLIVAGGIAFTSHHVPTLRAFRPPNSAAGCR